MALLLLYLFATLQLMQCGTLINHKWVIFPSSCVGPIGNHFGINEMLIWVSNLTKVDPIITQRRVYIKNNISPVEDFI